MDLCVSDDTEEEFTEQPEEAEHENITYFEEGVDEHSEETICREKCATFPCPIPKGKWPPIYQYDLVMFRLYQKIKLNEENTSSLSEYLRQRVYPYLVPAFQKMCLLAEAKEFLRKPNQIFECLDCIAEILYNSNPNRPFGWKWKPIYIIFKNRDFLKDHPRPVYPLNYVLTENDAAIMIQALIRGYLCRKNLNLDLLRRERKKRLMKEKCLYLRKGSLRRFE